MRHLKYIFKFAAALAAAACISVALPEEAHAQQVAVKLNALYWTAMSPNVGVEIVTGEHSSIDFSVMGHYKPYGLNSKVFTFQPEYRYWFNGRPMIREYIGASAMVATYDMSLGNYVYKGNAYSAGITGGYVFALGKRWNFELCAGFSFLFFHHKQYCRHDNYDDYYIGTTVQANAWGYKLFPAKLGVTFSYIIK